MDEQNRPRAASPEAPPKARAAKAGPPPDPKALAAHAERARDVLGAIVERMGLGATVKITRTEPDVGLEIEAPDTALLIGKKGVTLDALQLIVNKVVNRGDEWTHIVVDAGGYRDRYDESLRSMAAQLGERVRREGKVVAVDPMSSRDRRIIHLALAKVPGVRTESQGEGELRRVQIIPVRDEG